MFSEEERKIFVEYSLQDEKKLSISINAALSFDHLRKKIIQRFIEDLERSLREKLDKLTGSWEMENSIKDNVFDHWRGIFVYKTIWGNNYRIGFSAEKYNAREFLIGVHKSGEKLPHIGGLFEKLNKEYKQGRQSDSWNWYQWLDHPYQNWDNEEILILMYRSEAVDYFTKHMVTLIDVSTDIIDAHMKNSNIKNNVLNSGSL